MRRFGGVIECRVSQHFSHARPIDALGVGQLDLDARQAVPDQRDGEVHPAEQRTRVHPGVSTVGVAGWRLTAVQRHPELLKPAHQPKSSVNLGVERAHAAHDELQGGLHLGPLGLSSEKVGRREDQPCDLSQVTIGLQEARRRPLDECRRRVVGDEPAHELGGDEACGGRMTCKQVEHLVTAGLPVP